MVLRLIIFEEEDGGDDEGRVFEDGCHSEGANGEKNSITQLTNQLNRTLNVHQHDVRYIHLEASV